MFSRINKVYDRLFIQNEELKQEIQKLQGIQTNNLEDEMLGSKRRSAIERHKEQLKKLEKEKKDAQTV